MTTSASKPSVLSDEAFDNVTNCRFTVSSTKARYLNKMESFNGDTSKAERYHNRRRRGRIRKGAAPLDLEQVEGLGVAVRRDLFLSKTAKKLGMSPMRLAPKVDNWIAYSKKKVAGDRYTATERQHANSMWSVTCPARTDGEIWLFRSQTRKIDAFEGIPTNELGKRLGLNYRAGEQRIGLNFPMRYVNDIARPTMFDCTWGYLSYWDWKGFTRSLDRSLSGFEEVVAQPPRIKDVRFPVIELEFT